MIKLLSESRLVVIRKRITIFRKKLANTLIFLGDMLAIWNINGEYK